MDFKMKYTGKEYILVVKNYKGEIIHNIRSDDLECFKHMLNGLMINKDWW